MTRDNLLDVIEELSLKKGIAWNNLNRLATGELALIANLLGSYIVHEKLLSETFKDKKELNRRIEEIMVNNEISFIGKDEIKEIQNG